MLAHAIIHESETPPDLEYLVQKKENIQFTLRDFIRTQIPFDKKTKRRIKKELIAFFIDTSEFSSLSGDFFPSQIGWDGNRWILLDWTGNIKQFSKLDDPHPGDEILGDYPFFDEFFSEREFISIRRKQIRLRKSLLQKKAETEFNQLAKDACAKRQ
ncbi:MAG: hypothetical protein AB1540_16230 [Bdellovibrionota bacterium]